MYMSQGSVRHMAKFVMSARGRTILAACAKHQNKKGKPRKLEKKVHEIEYQENAELFIGTIEIERSEQTASKWLAQINTVSTMESENKKWTSE